MNVIKIGRSQENDYIVNNQLVSGSHADIVINDDGSVFYVDHSTNGTMIDDKVIHHATIQLYGNETITLPGGYSFSIHDVFAVSSSLPTGTIAGVIPSVPIERKYAKVDNSYIGNEEDEINRTINPGMSFGETFIYFFNHYVDFSGRARRKEYWYIVLWNLIFLPVYPIWGVVSFIPFLALFWRRMHDIGKSGWLYLLNFIPIIGTIIIFIFLCTDSLPYKNEYGASPKYSK